MKLYQYGEAFQEQIDQVQELLDSGADPESDEVQEKLRAMVACEGDFQEKAVEVALYIRELQADSEAARIEADRLAKLVKARERRAESLKDYLKFYMEQFGIDSIKNPLCTLSMRKNPPSVQVSSFEALPPEFIKTTVAADKNAIKAALKKGVAVSGASLVETVSLRIA